jgi:signal transduction histidine kinase
MKKDEKELRIQQLEKELAQARNDMRNITQDQAAANKELLFQNEEKEKRAAELIIANKELHFQSREKEKRSSELILANKELLFQNEEKEKRAAELIIANKELHFQSREKEKRSSELILANKELLFQNEEKEKRAAELIIANKELESFNYVSSHDLQEPLRKIQTFAALILKKEYATLSVTGKDYFNRMHNAAKRMQTLIEDLLTYSHTNVAERRFEITNLNKIIEEVKTDLKDSIKEKEATIEATELCEAYINPSQFHQVLYNLISNALKFASPERQLHILIKTEIFKGSNFRIENLTDPVNRLLPEKEYCHISITDNGIGFDQEYADKIFELFQRLHGKEEYAGTGIGLAIVKKVIESHNGIITAKSEPGEGTTFDIYIPAL